MGFTKDWADVPGEDISGSYVLEEIDPPPITRPASIVWGDAAALDPELNWAGRGFSRRNTESAT